MIMAECKGDCWCKKYPVQFSEIYEATQPLWEALERLNGRLQTVENVVLSPNPHKCPVCLGKRTVERRDVVNDCVTCDATGIVWG